MTVGDRIRNRRLECDLSVDDVAAKIGKSRATVYRYESNEVESLPVNLIGPLAQALDTTPAYLMGWEDEPVTIPPGFEPMPEMDFVPLVGRIACGEPITAEENVEGIVSVPAQWRATFTLRCRGDSMTPKIQDGDLVAIRKQPDVEQGQIAAVRIGGEATLKRVYKYSDRVVLQPENTSYPPIMLAGAEINTVSIEGLAVGLCRGL